METKTAAQLINAKALVEHTRTCRACDIKGKRLLAATANSEKHELLCAIELCSYRRDIRRAHA